VKKDSRGEVVSSVQKDESSVGGVHAIFSRTNLEPLADFAEEA
jgi:hypothetical protein